MRTVLNVLLGVLALMLFCLIIQTAALADVVPELRGPLTYDRQVYRYMRVEAPDGSVWCIRMDVRDFHFDKDGRVQYTGLRVVDLCEAPRRRGA